MASSSQSRADVVVIFVSAVLTLTGLQWLSLKPKVPATVELEGEVVNFVGGNVPEDAAEELSWCVGWTPMVATLPVFDFTTYRKDQICVHMQGMASGAMGHAS